MRVLIVEERLNRGAIWKAFLERNGAQVCLVTDSDSAMTNLTSQIFDALVINIAMKSCAILAISDLASYRNPNIAIVTVTAGSFFSDGSIFKLMPNACGCLGDDVQPQDLADIVSHYGDRSRRRDHGVRTSQRSD